MDYLDGTRSRDFRYFLSSSASATGNTTCGIGGPSSAFHFSRQSHSSTDPWDVVVCSSRGQVYEGTVRRCPCLPPRQQRRQGSIGLLPRVPVSYHHRCLGPRDSREHLVTKIGDQDFVLQCRRCAEAAVYKAIALQKQCCFGSRCQDLRPS